MSEAEYCPDSDEGEEADALPNQNTQQSGERRYLRFNAVIRVKVAREWKHLDVEDVEL